VDPGIEGTVRSHEGLCRPCFSNKEADFLSD